MNVLFIKNGGTFYQKRIYVLLKMDIRFIKNEYTFFLDLLYFS